MIQAGVEPDVFVFDKTDKYTGPLDVVEKPDPSRNRVGDFFAWPA
jgi:hypothetical protein